MYMVYSHLIILLSRHCVNKKQKIHNFLFHSFMTIPKEDHITEGQKSTLSLYLSPKTILQVSYRYRVIIELYNTGLSQPFLGMGPGPLELGKIASFRLKLGKKNTMSYEVFIVRLI